MDLQDMMQDEEFDTEILADTIEAVQGEYEDKIETYCKIIKNLEADIPAITAECERLARKQKTIENRIKALKDRMMQSMYDTGMRKVKGNLFTVSIQKNGGKQPVIIDTDRVEDIPAELTVVKVTPSVTEIRKWLEAGNTAPWAHLGERKENLQIR